MGRWREYPRTCPSVEWRRSSPRPHGLVTKHGGERGWLAEKTGGEITTATPLRLSTGKLPANHLLLDHVLVYGSCSSLCSMCVFLILFHGSYVVFVDFQVSGLAQRRTWISIKNRSRTDLRTIKNN